MKHKAQESWKRIQEDDYEYDDGMGIVYDSKEADKDWDTLQDLINCQLTAEQLVSVILTLRYELEMIDHPKDIERQEAIIEKLKKQREMWVSEDV